MADSFYAQLNVFDDFVGVCDPTLFQPVPRDWDMVITDVVESTRAIEAGKYREVNASGVASIAAVRNAMKGVAIPFVFGGDGATLITPASRREDLQEALRGLRRHCKEAFDLDLRVGIVPMADLIDADAPVFVGRFAASPQVSFAMLRGDGVELAERWIKSPEKADLYKVEDGPGSAILDGFECRWRPIPARNGLAVSLIVKALGTTEDEQNRAYRHVLDEIHLLSQTIDEGRPTYRRGLRLRKGPDAFNLEIALRSAANPAKAAEIASTVKRHVRNARFLLATRLRVEMFNPRTYKQELVANTDFRKFDNVLRMHLDLRRGHLERLKEVLQLAEDDGYLVYGIHTAQETLMTCIVDSYEGSHAHFVDGASGGYALAAKRIKALLSSRLPAT